jgi:hypothetical protein
MASDDVISKAKRITIVGAAVIMVATLMGATWTAAVKTYAFAQRVETYVGLPDWLGKVEKKVDTVVGKVDVVVEKTDAIAEEQRATNARLDAWMRAESRRRRAVVEPGEGR